MKKQILFLVMMTTTQLNKQQLNTITTTMKKISLLLLMSFMTLWTAKAQNDITLSCPDENHPHAIDLGLPSGTKWACCNVGADKPEAYGGYYAWGEIEEKSTYTEMSYQYCTGEDTDGDGYYDSNISYQSLGSDIANTEYDVAHVKWGGSWVMPSHDQQMELISSCTYTWTSINGVSGEELTGPNGCTIFFPAAGFAYLDEVYHSTADGNYWSSTQNPMYSYFTYHMQFASYNVSWGSYNHSRGLSVRPVISVTNSIHLPESSSDKSSQAVYNVFGIKVADDMENADILPSGIYIHGGKKVVVK